jgi:hypothetical protein
LPGSGEIGIATQRTDKLRNETERIEFAMQRHDAIGFELTGSDEIGIETKRTDGIRIETNRIAIAIKQHDEIGLIERQRQN